MLDLLLLGTQCISWASSPSLCNNTSQVCLRQQDEMVICEQEFFLPRMKSEGFIHRKAPSTHKESMMGQGETCGTLYFSVAAILRSSQGATSRSLDPQSTEPGIWWRAATQTKGWDSPGC